MTEADCEHLRVIKGATSIGESIERSYRCENCKKRFGIMAVM